ncbi:MAG TPA: BatA domain-containing protein [Gemmatimonadaceae bacterium]|nr:BatA domain-containing protein [Gemmatimonadaceae bacterium]
MGLSFLAPLFLAGLAALAIPVALHLAQRERKQVVEFPSLMFLRKIPHKAEKRRRLRDLALLAVRCLALALLAAAFARPLLSRGDALPAAGTGGAREVVILLDRSWSMGAGDRWARALDAARRAADGIRPGDRATLVLFDATAAAATQPTGDHAVLRAAIADATLGARTTRYAPALRLASQLLEASDRPRREAVLITDFQKRGWDGREEVHLPPGTTLTRVDLSGGDAGDVAVASVALGRSMRDGREHVAASARLVNTGAEPVRDVRATLELNGRGIETSTATVPANGATTVTFTAVPIPEGTTRGIVRIAPPRGDALPQDDAFHFALRRGEALPVLIVEHADAAADASLYLRRALAVGDDPPFQVTVARAPRLTTRDIDGRRLVVWNDAGAMPRDIARRLEEHVRRGGGLVVAAGERTPAPSGAAESPELLPGTFGEMVDRSADRGATLGVIDRGHAVFAPFAAPRSGDWGAARFLRYRPIQPAPSAAALARFDDGSVALAERRVGAGRVLAWGSTLDTFWGDLPLQPVWVPFVHEMAKHAAGFTRERAWATVGEVVDGRDEGSGARGQVASGGEIVARAPSGATTRIAARPAGAAGTVSAAPLELTEQGFWELRPAGEPTAQPRIVAANLDLAEADLARLDPEELAAAVAPRPGAPGAAREAEAALTREERERRQAAWWWLLAGALLLLAAETVVSNMVRGTRGEGRGARELGFTMRSGASQRIAERRRAG